ncbi:ELL-associated factor [Purpureocillium lavendulum]|uniref:ELL-associated factor n=1 Tax=Purpureocillium lavendulum TaxID=1247861 RepID=A0AB34G0A9_9HYPO|nr:ELL-associated factor [Purpureocillium lavendulum]
MGGTDIPCGCVEGLECVRSSKKYKIPGVCQVPKPKPKPYLGLPPEAALVVLTSVLGASANWLVQRCLYSLLRSRQRGGAGADDVGDGVEGHDVGVVLVSFMRDGAFWRDGASRLGLDLDALRRAGKFTFVDGLTGLVVPASPDARDRVLQSPELEDVRKGIEAAIAEVRASRTVLIVDQIDTLLAVTNPSDTVTSLSVQNMLLSLRERVHATILTLAADDPLLHPQTTSLEREHAALVLSQLHTAQTVMALRMLDTGAAKDVSGVVRITARGDDVEEGGRAVAEGDGEYLYYVAGDGSVRVFERGT